MSRFLLDPDSSSQGWAAPVEFSLPGRVPGLGYLPEVCRHAARQLLHRDAPGLAGEA